MADQAFERRLERLFAQTPSMSDSHSFAARVEERLERGWSVRRFAIGAAGLLGGGVAVLQALGSDLPGRLESAGRASAGAAGQGARLLEGATAALPALGAAPFGGEILWSVGGLAALAVALLTTRLIERW